MSQPGTLYMHIPRGSSSISVYDDKHCMEMTNLVCYSPKSENNFSLYKVASTLDIEVSLSGALTFYGTQSRI